MMLSGKPRSAQNIITKPAPALPTAAPTAAPAAPPPASTPDPVPAAAPPHVEQNIAAIPNATHGQNLAAALNEVNAVHEAMGPAPVAETAPQPPVAQNVVPAPPAVAPAPQAAPVAAQGVEGPPAGHPAAVQPTVGANGMPIPSQYDDSTAALAPDLENAFALLNNGVQQ